MTFKPLAVIESDRREAYGGARVDMLLAMLQTKRPHDSSAESRFIAEYLDSVPRMRRDEYGNRWLLIDGKGDSVIWSSHVDTVHYEGGPQRIRKARDIVSLSPKSKSNCLGADDTAGVWLMLEMIAAGKPGFYLFHRGEECGGLGSGFIADKTPAVVSDFRAAIALDRKGYASVITHQGARCASDAFANSLADGLGIVGLGADDTGLFTDTANYTDLVGECSNLSVGYFEQHTARESLDVAFLIRMRAALLGLNVDSLVIERKPGEIDASDISFMRLPPNRKRRNRGKAFHSLDDRDDSYCLNYDSTWHNGHDIGERAAEDFELVHLARLLRDKPERSARVLRELGITLDEFCQCLYSAADDQEIPF